jgi:hypothetical protein
VVLASFRENPPSWPESDESDEEEVVVRHTGPAAEADVGMPAMGMPYPYMGGKPGALPSMGCMAIAW